MQVKFGWYIKHKITHNLRRGIFSGHLNFTNKNINTCVKCSLCTVFTPIYENRSFFSEQTTVIAARRFVAYSRRLTISSYSLKKTKQKKTKTMSLSQFVFMIQHCREEEEEDMKDAFSLTYGGMSSFFTSRTSD